MDRRTIDKYLNGFIPKRKPKGRPPMSEKAKYNNDKNNNENNLAYEQKLEREYELLRLEVEYLKKLLAFQMDPEGYLEKHSSVIIRTQRNIQINRCQ